MAHLREDEFVFEGGLFWRVYRDPSPCGVTLVTLKGYPEVSHWQGRVKSFRNLLWRARVWIKKFRPCFVVIDDRTPWTALQSLFADSPLDLCEGNVRMLRVAKHYMESLVCGQQKRILGQ